MEETVQKRKSSKKTVGNITAEEITVETAETPAVETAVETAEETTVETTVETAETPAVETTVETAETTAVETTVETTEETTEETIDINGFKIFSRNALSGLTPVEAQAKMKENVAAFAKRLHKFRVPQLFKNDEKVLMDIMAKYDAYLTELKYTLPTEIVFENITYSIANISEKLNNFLDRVSGEWNFAKSMYEIYKAWENSPSEISYKNYAATLNWLGNQKFEGYADWLNILIVNAFMEIINKSYIYDMIYQYYLAELHNEILSGLNKGKKTKK